MKKNKTLFTILLVIMIIPQIGWSQNHETHDHDNVTVVTPKKEPWKPVNKFAAPNSVEQSSIAAPAPLINVLNGVSFYSMTSMCNSEKVILLKLINSNNYPVKVAWQMKSTAPEVVVEVPAGTDYEGNCTIADKDKNKAKLVIMMPQDADKDEIKKYVFSHLTVSRLEKQ